MRTSIMFVFEPTHPSRAIQLKKRGASFPQYQLSFCKTQFVEFVFDKLYWKVELTCMGACGVTDEWSKFESFIKVTFKRVPPFCRQMHALYDVEAFFKQENIQFYGRRVLGIQTWYNWSPHPTQYSTSMVPKLPM